MQINKDTVQNLIDSNQNARPTFEFVEWCDRALEANFPDGTIWAITPLTGKVLDEVAIVAESAGMSYIFDRSIYTIAVYTPDGKCFFWNMQDWIDFGQV